MAARKTSKTVLSILLPLYKAGSFDGTQSDAERALRASGVPVNATTKREVRELIASDVFSDYDNGPKPKRITDEDVKAATDIINRDYWQDVHGIGDELMEQFARGEIPDDDTFQERLHQDVEGSQRVIYTWQNKLGMLSTNHPDAYTDAFGDAPIRDGQIDWAGMMFESLQADVLAYIGDRISFDD